MCHKAYARSDVLARHIRMHQRKDDEVIDSPLSNLHERTASNGGSYAQLDNDSSYQMEGGQNGHLNHYTGLNSTEDRFSMPQPSLGPSPFNTPSNGQYAHSTPNSNAFAQLPALNGYGTSNDLGTNFNLLSKGMNSLPPYNTNIPYQTSLFSQQTYMPISQPTVPSSPIQYSNFPPNITHSGIDNSPLLHEAASWQKPAIDAQESNVRGSSKNIFQNGLQNDYNITSSVGPDLSKLEGSEGLQNWLAVTQHSNPVNSILRLNGHRPPSAMSNGHSKLGDADDFESQLDKMRPMTSGNLGRYARVEQTWYSRLSSQGRWPGAQKRWYDVLQGMSGDLFNSVSPTCPVPIDGSRCRVSEACRSRMISAIFPVVTNPYNPAYMGENDHKAREEALARFPSCAAFDVALDTYFSSFNREAPFLHLPIFSISTCHPLLLFVMSCIGFGLGKTTEGCQFVQSNFNCTRVRIVSELEKKLASTTKDALSIFATSFLFLKLAALISDRDHLSPCQLLYISLVSLAQLHGMFTEYGKHTSAEMYSGLNSLHDRWTAWGRVESLKRISVSLMRLDSAYGTFLKSAPTIRVANIEALLPCDDVLFEAPTAEAWYSLQESEHLPVVMPPLGAVNSLDKLVGTTYLNYYSLHAVLNYLQLRSLDAYQRLLEYQTTQEQDRFVLVPYQFYATEPSLSNMTNHVIAFIDSYQNLLPRFPTDWQRTNCLVFWHFLCLSLTMNQDLFEIATGREGPKAAASAIDSIATWAHTQSARRALVHAASIYQLLSKRTQSEMSSLYAAFATFAAALVMTLYVFAHSSPNALVIKDEVPYELTTEVEWQGFGLVGLSPTATMNKGSATEHFILHGGSSVFNGRRLQGFPGARYILTLYADLLKDCGRYNYRQMSQILFMMSDLLQQTQSS